MPAAPSHYPGRAPRSKPRKKHMTPEATQTTDLTERIQARDGVAVVLYTKNDCRWCDMTKKVLERDHVYYTAVNIEEDATAYRYVTETLNRREMPVVIASTPEVDEVWSGFQPAMIRKHITHREDNAA